MASSIQEAKKHIINTVKSYTTRNEFGDPIISIEKQRPIILMGPPGIGKTAIMAQVAGELGIGLVSYSMTHHTRQSALGLPFITTKTYGGKEYDVSNYTMSEIIASVYDMIESTGCKEGILFLDEINCVSETLHPAMLQFLQYKTFGTHAVPEGWVIVTAGNPPEYNNSVREFDIVTWDRLKRIDIEPDYSAWREHAIVSGVHPAIASYLEIKKSHFYDVKTTVDGKTFVTARGWSDLSDILKLYEMNKLAVDKSLVSQYLQNEEIARDFAIYYDLFVKYRSDYQIDSILNGRAPKEIYDRAKRAKFDERIAFIGMLMDRLNFDTKNVICTEMKVMGMKSDLESLKRTLPGGKGDVVSALKSILIKRTDELEKGKKASSLSEEALISLQSMVADYERFINEATKNNGTVDYDWIKKYFNNNIVEPFKTHAGRVEDYFTNAFKFVEAVFKSGSQSDMEMTVFTTDITISPYTSLFIAHFGGNEYYKNNKALLMSERFKDLGNQVTAIPDLDLN